LRIALLTWIAAINNALAGFIDQIDLERSGSDGSGPLSLISRESIIGTLIFGAANFKIDAEPNLGTSVDFFTSV
jgi:hypothetical protein